MLVSELVLGAAAFGTLADAATTDAIVAEAMNAGINTFDTADIYGAGRSEELLGAALKHRRDQVIICTKVGAPLGDSEADRVASLQPGGLDHGARWARGIAPTDQGLSRKHILDAVEASLRRLGTDYIDLYQLHRFDHVTPVEETLGVLDDLVHQGKVRAVGCSGWASWQLYRGLWLAERHHTVRIEAAQVPLNVVQRESLSELLPACDAASVSTLVYRSLAGGVLTGRYRDGSAPGPDTRVGSRDRFRDLFWNDDVREATDALAELADQIGTTSSGLAVGWVLAQFGVTAVLYGASRVGQIAEGARCAAEPLSPDVVEAVDAVVRPR
jgi:aryl-alcohol dehydrogenase-like predicted oxidoreductase